MCNNSPTENISPENGSRLNGLPILLLQKRKNIFWSVALREINVEVLDVNLNGINFSADLGASSNDSDEISEGRSE